MDGTDRIIIVAMTGKGIIGREGKIPWRIPEDVQLFKKLTVGGTVIMGRKTFESIGRPLPDRHNIVISSQHEIGAGIDVCRNLSSALELAESYGKKIFFIGGARIYEESLSLSDYLYISWIKGDYAGDTRFPSFSPEEWEKVSEEDYESFRFEVRRRRRPVN